MEIFLKFLWLGLTSFGGPIAHIAIFRRQFVVKANLYSESAYANLVALCQVIPGPTSSQIGMSVGYRLNGSFGAFCAWLGFTLPSAIFMGVAGYLVLSGYVYNAGWAVIAMKCVALGFVTQAVIGMWKELCTDHATKITAVLGAMIFFYLPGSLSQVLLIGAALLIGYLMSPAKSYSVTAHNRSPSYVIGSYLILIIFFSLLAATIIVKSDYVLWNLFSGHFKTGSLVFGGGHVVLPLLEFEYVPPLSTDTFFAGYGIAQIMPGPLFTIASYIGSASYASNPAIGAAVATSAIFLPGAIVLAVMNFFGATLIPRLLTRLRFVNAVVVGLLFSTLINPLFTSSVYNGATTGLAMISLGLVVGLKRSPLETATILLVISYLLSLLTILD